MKHKNIFKIIICLALSCSLAVCAPCSRYQRVESHAAIAVPIAIGAGTIALMYLAACGVSYIFQGMSQAEAEEWIDTKIIEFSEISDGNGGTNGPMPSGPSNWKMTALGALLIGSTLSNWLSRFVAWIKGSQADNTVENLVTSSSVSLNGNDIQIVNLPTLNSNTVATDLIYGFDYDTLQNYTSSDPYVYNADPLVCLYWTGGYAGSGIIWVGVSSPTNNGTNWQIASSTRSGGSALTRKVALCYDEGLEGFVWVACNNQTNISNPVYYQMRLGNAFTLSDAVIEETSVSQKTETVTIPQEIVNNYYYTINPDVQTTTQDLNGVPVPLSADDIAAAVWEKISMNTAATTVYQPELLPAADGFSDQANINTDDYDEPLPEPEPEPQPDWDSMTAGDVPAFTQSVWNYFLQNNTWNNLKTKFPFSLPYDAYLISKIFYDTSYDVMDELPTEGNTRRLIKSASAPVYVLQVPWGYGDPYTLTLDFSLLDPWRPMFRAAAGVLFTVALIVGVL